MWRVSYVKVASETDHPLAVGTALKVVGRFLGRTLQTRQLEASQFSDARCNWKTKAQQLLEALFG